MHHIKIVDKEQNCLDVKRCVSYQTSRTCFALSVIFTVLLCMQSLQFQGPRQRLFPWNLDPHSTIASFPGPHPVWNAFTFYMWQSLGTTSKIPRM